MRLSALIREAWRDVATGTARFSLFCVTLALLVGGLTAADSLIVLRQIEQAAAFRDSGGATLVLEARGRVDGEACARLRGGPEVRAAGALRARASRLVPSALPGAPVPQYDVTPDFVEVISASLPTRTGVVIAQDVADALSVAAGGAIATGGGDVLVAGTFSYPSDGRRPGFGYAALSPSDSRAPFDECWVSAWPQVSNLRALLFTTLRPGEEKEGGEPRISQLNSSLGGESTADEQYRTRVTRAAPPLAFVAALCIGAVAVRLRRLEAASALHCGVSRRDVLTVHALETAAWAATATVFGVAVAVICAVYAPEADRSALLGAEAGIPLAGFAGAVLGALLAAALTRRRHLFRYFRDR